MNALPDPAGRLVLGIETSCDETAVAVLRDDRTILAEPVLDQLLVHAPYGGVVPELAARAHVERLDRLIVAAMKEAGVTFEELSGIAATAGPGLIGGLAVGLVTAKVLAAIHGKPLLAVNHLEAHALTARLTHGLDFPYVLLLVSGGHGQLQLVSGVGRYRRLGTTLDDAVGEAFDKVAKMLGLGYPGGPRVEAMALSGDPARFPFPRPLLGQPNCNLSFSGLKTAVRQAILRLGEAARDQQMQADLCASFQVAVADVLADRTSRALRLVHAELGRPVPLVVAGGVAANLTLRARLEQVAAAADSPFAAPPLRLCGDNGVMVAWVGVERLALGQSDPLDVPARARWPLDLEAEPLLGAGAKGTKA